MYSGTSRKSGNSISLCNKIQGRRVLRRKALLALSAAAGIAALAGQAFGQTNDTWVGTGANGDWSTSGNWTPGTPGTPGGGTVNDTATFNSTTGFTSVIVDSTGDNLESIVFGVNAAAYTIGVTAGPSLDLTNAGSISLNENETANQIINAPIVLEGTSYTISGSSSYNDEAASPTGTLTFNSGISGGNTAATVLTLAANTSTIAAAGTNVINGIISNGAATNLALHVSGIWTLNGANTFTGGAVSTGTVNIANNKGLGTGGITSYGTLAVTGPGPVTLSNAVSDLDNLTGTNSLVLTGTVTGAAFDSAFTYPATTNDPWYEGQLVNNATNGATLTVNNISITPVGSTGPGSIGISGTGPVALNGVISDGAVAGATLFLESGAVPGYGDIIYVNGANTYTGGTVISTPENNFYRGTDIINNKSAFGTGLVDFSSMILAAAVPLTGANALANNFQIDPNNGSFFYNVIGPQSAAITITGSLVDDSTDETDAVVLANRSNGMLTLAGNVSLGLQGFAGTLGIDFAPGSTAGGLGNITVTGVISDGGSAPEEVTTGNHDSDDDSPGILYLANSHNTYTAGTYLTGYWGSGPTVNFVNGALSSGPLLMAGGTLQWATGNTQDISGLLAEGEPAGGLFAGGIGGSGSIFDTNGNNVTFNTAITCTTGGIVKTGAGTLTLAASANNITGVKLAIEGGTLALGSATTVTTGGTTGLNIGAGTLYLAAGAGGVSFSDFIAGEYGVDVSADYAPQCEGAGAIVAAPGYSNVLALAGIVRLPGSTIDFTPPTTGGGTFTTTSTNVLFTGGQQTILGGWATVNNGSTWAVSGSGTTAGTISGLTSFSATVAAATDVDAPIGTSTPGTMTINSLRLNNPGAYTIADSGGGNTLTIATGGILETTGVGANAVNINVKYLTSANDYGYYGYYEGTGNGPPPAIADVILNQYNTAGKMTISSIIEDNASTALSVGLTKTGPGTVVLTGANTYTGITNINMGTLEVGSGGDIASSAIDIQGGVLTVDSGATLASTTQLQVGSSINVQGGTVDAPGVVNFNNAAQTLAVLFSNGTVNLNGTALTLTNVPASNVNPYPNAKLTTSYWDFQFGGFYGNINGTGSLIINETTSTSTMSLFGGVIGAALPSTYSGGTTITSGVLSFSNINELGTGAITLNGGANSTLQWSGTNADVSGLGLKLIGSGGVLDTNGLNVTLANAIGGGGAGSLTKVGIGTLYLNGANTWTGATNVTVGTLELQSGTLASTNVTVNGPDPVAGDTILNVDAGASLNSATALTDNDFVNFNNASQTIATLIAPGTGVVNLNGTALTITNGDNGTPVVAAIQGTGSVKLAGGTLTLNGSNNQYSGGTTVSGGTLIAGVNNALPTNGAVVNNSVLNVNGSNAVGAITGSGNLTVGAGANTLQIAANSAQSSQTSITVAAGSTLDITNNSIVLTPTAGTQATELAYYLGLVKQGYNSGSWKGTGITSSAVAAANAVTPLYGVAVAENDGSYGTVVGLANGQIEIAEAVIGDATLSGTVNFADFVKVEGNYGLTGADWDEGDFFYTGTVNFADFVAVEANFGDTNAISAPEMAAMQSFAGTFGDALVANSDGVGFQVVSVPEPASAGLLALATFGILGRRRRREHA